MRGQLLKHIQKANAALAALTPEKLANLSAGEAYVWSSKATDESFSKGTMQIAARARSAYELCQAPGSLVCILHIHIDRM